MNDETPSAGSGKGLGIASLICGIGAFFPGCLCGGFSIIIAIVALIFGVISRNKGGGGMATAGLVLSIIYIVLYLVGMILILSGAVSADQFSMEGMSGGGGAAGATGGDGGG